MRLLSDVQALFFLGGNLGGCIITIEPPNPHQCSVVQRAGSLWSTGREDSLLRERPHEHIYKDSLSLQAFVPANRPSGEPLLIIQAIRMTTDPKPRSLVPFLEPS